MERKSILKNNKGGGLIIVIGCVALLSMVGAMLLVVTTNNRKMKDLELQAQQSFYGAESGSDEMVAQLEIEAEEAIKRAFGDMMVQYSLSGTSDERKQRYAQFFQTALEEEVTGSTAAEDLMREALGVPAGTPLDVSVNFPTVETVPLVGDISEICIRNATFTYSAAGTETTITTDIKVKTKIPDVEGSLTTGTMCDFSDFALIAGEDIATVLNTTQTVTIDGNLYTHKSLLHGSNGMTMNVNNADKFLVAKDLQVYNGAKMNINGGTQVGGEGVWADGIVVSNGGQLSADSNFYVSDDLTMSMNGAKVDINGNEYIGYSGGNAATDNSAANSAITINTAKDITLDMSGMNTLVLNGSSYIRDALWGSIGDASNALGILQGESMAYKDMQSIYLIPGECLTTKHNPMTLTEYNTAAAAGSLLSGTEISYVETSVAYGEDPNRTFSFAPYLAADPYVVRHVKLDGGATEFVYLYMNFKDAKQAQMFFKDYMAIDELAEPVQKRLKNLGNSIIKLAQNNYTLANTFHYNAADDTYGVQEATTVFSHLGTSSLLAKKRTGGLFTNFNMNATAPTGREYDIITNKILKKERFSTTPLNAWQKHPITVDGVTYDFWVYNTEATPGVLGNVVIESDAPTNSGIILVNGKLTLKNTSMDFNGLVLATGGVEFDSATKLTSNQAAVDALLTVPLVQEYFQATGSSSPVTPYLSTEAVSISFENWKKN